MPSVRHRTARLPAAVACLAVLSWLAPSAPGAAPPEPQAPLEQRSGRPVSGSGAPGASPGVAAPASQDEGGTGGSASGGASGPQARFAPARDDGPLGPGDVALGLALALAVGGLISVERESHARTKNDRTFGGIRTFPLLALLGALSSLATHALGPWALLPPL